jgi:hypothetical protein
MGTRKRCLEIENSIRAENGLGPGRLVPAKFSRFVLPDCPFLISVLPVEKREPQKLEVDKRKEIQAVDLTVVECEPSMNGAARMPERSHLFWGRGSIRFGTGLREFSVG